MKFIPTKIDLLNRIIALEKEVFPKPKINKVLKVKMK